MGIMYILITGGAGFIGTHTATALHAAGHHIHLLDCLDPQIHGAHAEFPDELTRIATCTRGDVCRLDDCLHALEGIDAVYHLASRTGVGQSMYDLGDYVATNVHGTAVLIEAILKSGRPLKRFVLASSRAVYGEGLFHCPEHGVLHPSLRSPAALRAGDFAMHCPHCDRPMRAVPTSTDCPPEPLSVYALSKKQQEDYCNHAARTLGLPLVTLRYFNVYGSRQSLKNPYTGVVSIFFSLLREGKAISLYEGGLPIRDFVHVSDVVQANLLALNPALQTGEVFNVGSGTVSTITDIARTQAMAMGVEARIEDRGEFRIGDIFGCYADLSHTRAVLGLQAQVDLEQGMNEFVRWAETQCESASGAYEKTVAELRQYGLFGQANKNTGSEHCDPTQNPLCCRSRLPGAPAPLDHPGPNP